MLVLVCPDKFRGTATATEAAEAIARGWARVRPGDVVEVAPMADGGEGTLEALVTGRGRTLHARVAGPLDEPIDAAWGLRDDGAAIIEMARAAGLTLLSEARRDPRRTTTRGVGELIGHALAEGARRVLVCLGGSATNDGGTGMASALGARFLDANGRDLPPGGAALTELARIDITGVDARLRATEIVGLTDVDNPLCGPFGASAVYGPQKGASTEHVLALDRGLGNLSAVVNRDLGADFADEPGAGSAGGLGFGLLAFCGARLRPGAAAVAEALGLQERVRAADLIVTGEGAFDATSLQGKVAGTVLEMATLATTPAAVVCGRADIRPDGVEVIALVDLVGEGAALGETRRALERAGEDLAGRAASRTGPR